MDLNFVRRGAQICSTPEMKRHVICLYREVFEFLSYTMKWYSSAWQRLWDSNAHYYDKEVVQRVAKIRGLVKRVHDELKLGTDEIVRTMQAETRAGFRDTNTQIGELADSLKNLDGKFKQLGDAMFSFLVANCQHGKQTFGDSFRSGNELNLPWLITSKSLCLRVPN